VVTGTYEPVPLEETNRALTVLPVRSISMMLNSLVDSLQLDPSLDLQERAPGGVQTDLSIRGSSFGQTLVLLNGLRLDDAQSGHHDMDIPVPLAAVERIEVLRGSGSTTYGSDAVGGVINIITTPPEGFEFRLRAALGSFGTNQQSGSISDSFGPIAEQLTFSRDFSDGFLPDRDYRNLQFGSDTNFRSAFGRADLTLGYMDHPFGADQFYGNYPSWEDTKTWFAGVHQAFGKKTNVSFAYRRHSDLFVLFRDRPEIYANHHSDESFQAAVRREEIVAANTELHYGIEGLHESIVSNNLGNHARSRAAAYAALDFRALHRFSLTISAREEFYRSFSAVFNPTVAAAYWASTRVKFRASASRAFRVPSYTDLYYRDPANMGNPNLKPERATTYEGGLDWNPAGRLRGELTVFQRRERDGIDYYRASPADIWQALNIDNLTFTGVEAALRWTPVRTQTLDFRYTWLLGAQDTVPFGDTKYTFNYPSSSGVVSWQAGLPAGILFRTRLGVLDRRSASGPYPLWDLHLASSRGRVHPFLGISNITGTSYQEIQGVAMPGSTIIGGVELVVRGH
jgi:iron complex outermembrane recepter protein